MTKKHQDEKITFSKAISDIQIESLQQDNSIPDLNDEQEINFKNLIINVIKGSKPDHKKSHQD